MPASVKTQGSDRGAHQACSSANLLWESELAVVSSCVANLLRKGTLSELRTVRSINSLAKPLMALFFMSFLLSSVECFVTVNFNLSMEKQGVGCKEKVMFHKSV